MRKGLLGSLLVLLGGAPLVSAQGYLPYPPSYAPYAQMPPAYPPAPSAFPSFRARPAPAWPVGFQTAAQPMPRPMPQWEPLPGAPTGQPALPLPAGEPIAPPKAPPTPPAGERIGPPADAPTPKAAPDSTPKEPVVSPLSPDGGAVEPTELPPAADPAPGTPLTYGHDVPPPPPHEQHPPHHGPPGYCIYGTVDGLLWWTRARTAPPLLSTGPLGAGGGVVLLAGPSFDDQMRYGGRFTLSTWLNQHQTVGLEVGGLLMAEAQPSTVVGGASLARPFLNATTGAESAAVLAAPGTQTGSAVVQALQRFWGAEANLRLELLRDCWYHVDLLGGFRYFALEDNLSILDNTTFAPGLVGLGGASLSSSDRFTARNQFYGAQLGVDAEMHSGRFFVNLWGKVAVGPIHEVVTINGTTLVTSNAGFSAASVGGLLALPSNIGNYRRDTVGVLPEVGINCGVQVSSHLRAYVGYTFLYLSEAAQSGDQIDRTVNPAQRTTLAGVVPVAVGPARPQFAFQGAEFWAQGFNVGMEFRY